MKGCSSCSKTKMATGKPKMTGSKTKTSSKMSYGSPSKVNITFGRKK
jgi:hypothetical protein